MMKVHKFYFNGLRGDVVHYYFETHVGHVMFAAGSGEFYSFIGELSSRRKLHKQQKKCEKHEAETIDKPKLEAMIDRWCSTGNRWEADALIRKLENPVMDIVREEPKKRIQSGLWKQIHRLRKDPKVDTKYLVRALNRAKKIADWDDIADTIKTAERELAEHRKKAAAAT
ncbi:MAG: hypothetical protein KGI60_03245 [Patescibacteria group bacterium]|nr:hypothetical protein [Patescibacteria group bacterium]